MADEKTPLLTSNGSGPKVEFAPSSSTEKDEEPKAVVSLRQLFRFKDSTDIVLMILGTIGCLCYGVLAPGQFLIMRGLTNDFVDFVLCQVNNCSDPVDLEDSMSEVAGWYVGLGFANLLFAWMAMSLWGLAAERQVYKMKLALFRNIIRQEIGWFDTHGTGELSSRLTGDLNKIAEGIGPKLGRLMYSIVSFFASYAFGFSYLWQMTLVMMTVLPVMAICGGALAKVISGLTAQELSAYAKAGGVAEQTLSSIRTVAAYGGEERQTAKYDVHLNEARISGTKKGFGIGVAIAFFHTAIFSNYALSLWFGIKMVRDQDANSGDVMSVFFMVILGSTTLGQAGPCAQAFGTARAAAAEIFKLIDEESEIDPTSYEGLKPSTIKGEIELSNIDFVYPSRPDVKILKNFNLTIPSGKQVALVGESGCGKSTVAKLIQRFYDPANGTVSLDGQDIKSLNVRHLRNFIGVVEQEPVLFATTISENIAYGREGVTQREIEEAAKMANAHDFIIQFPQGYNTLCGERGVQMSGGQKQRISIARAVIRRPRILLLDEATSALDSHSEAVVQEALDRAGTGRTTVIIAHRLSTIRNADIIVAVKDGQVAEMGTHDELMATNGIYKNLVRLQNAFDVDDKDHEDDEDDEFVNSVELDKDGAFKLGSFTTSGSASYMSKIKTEDEKQLKPVTFFQLLKKNAPEWHYILIGCIGAACFGGTPFFYGICMGGIFDALARDPNVQEDRDDMEDDSKKFAVLFFVFGVFSGIGMFFQHWMFAKSGECLTQRLRRKAFKAFLRQDIAYFDDPKHNTGAISSRLSTEVALVQGATGIQLGYVAAALVSVVGCLVVSFYNTWRLSLVLLACCPLILVAGVFYMEVIAGSSRNISEEEAGQVAEETFSNIRTVASLGREEEFFERFRKATATPYRNAKRAVHFGGLTTGSVQCLVNITFAISFRYGGKLITDGDVTLKEMMTAIFTILAGAVILGNTSSMTPDYAKAKVAGQKLFGLLDLVPPIDIESDQGLKPDDCSGEVQLVNVRFRYPLRRNVKVLRNMNVTMKPGQTVALVGTSGCGKSTAVSLIERFYDTNDGSVTVDQNDVKALNLKWLRNQIGIVSQEPVLFDQTIRENIAFGNPGHVSDEEITEAAKAANVHDFIISLPKGYDTIVGEKGSLISGGQKQRIAIARALIRDPKILLLDEATSALDTESEKVVQQALDNASIGRTTLIIAHRLSTVQHADSIVVIRKGRVVERGTHQQLLALKGMYYALQKVQGGNGK